MASTANLIDEFFVAIGLDPSGFEAGKKQVEEASRKLRDGILSDNKQQAASAKSFQDSLRGVKTEALGLLLVLGGASTIKGFVGNIIAGDAATGRLANNLGIATDKLSAWEQAVQRVGGSKGDIDGSLSALSGIFLNAQQGDHSHAAQLAGLGLSEGDLRDPTEAALKLADASRRYSPKEFSYRAGMLGIDQNTINLLEKGRGAVKEYLREAEKNGVVTRDNAEAAQAFQSSLADLENQIKGAARPQVEALAGAFAVMSKDGKAAGLILPAIEGGLAAVGIAAGVAYAPVVALAAAIGAVIIAYNDWQAMKNATPEQKKAFNERGDRDIAQGWKDLKAGNFGGLISDIYDGAYGRWHANDSKAAASSPSAGGSIESQLVARGFSLEQARGIAAGIYAESKGGINATNPKSGAYGIGQWVGSRKAALFQKYGAHPSMANQLDFLAWELRGGDRGGSAVLGAGNSSDTALAYITRFMRPHAGYETLRDIRDAGKYLGNPRLGSGIRGGSSVMIGTVIVNTPDAKSFSRDLGSELRKREVIYQGQSGMQQ